VKGNIEVHIEELVLHGFAPSDRNGIGGGLERKLSRLFVEEGLPPSLDRTQAILSLDSGAFEVAPELGVEVVGVEVAKAVYKGLQNE
jgi:hypothetical protein